MRKVSKKTTKCVGEQIDSNSSNQQSDSEFIITETSESEKQKTKSIWSLKGLSSQIKNLVNELQNTTYKQLATILIERLSNELQKIHVTERRKEIQNLKRRVYDAINVMVAMGVLSKERKIISFHKSDRGILLFEKERVDLRQESIIKKRRKLTNATLTHLLRIQLIQRNHDIKLENEEENIYYLPVIGVSVGLLGNDFSMTQKSRKKLLLKSKMPIHIYSELDILHKFFN